MDFSNLMFPYIFLPIVILVYFLQRDIYRRNYVLLAASLLLYAMGQPLYMIFLVAISYFNYQMAMRIDPDDRSTVLLPVAMNVVLLAVLKVLDFFLLKMGAGLSNGLHMMGMTFQIPATYLPIGITCYVFSVISYLMDVYRNRIDPEEDFVSFLLYLLMFPKMFHGPIVRYEDVAEQLTARRHHPRAVFEGMRRFLFGLAKKILLADYCGRMLAEINAAGGDTTLVGVWFAAILFMFRIYYDFSGYCDMAIGLGRIFGFRFGENFNRPYLSLSVTEFCTRWNISICDFFRDYVYLPLGGDQLGKVRQVLNILIACVLGGIVYGTSWNFVLWGLYIFVLIVLEKHFIATLETLPDSLCRCLTLWLLLVGWILFSHDQISDLQNAFMATLGFGGFATRELGICILNSLPLMIVCTVGCTMYPAYVKRIFDGVCAMGRRRVKPNMVTPLRVVHLLVSLAVMCALLWLCTVSLIGSPSLDFRYISF